MSPKILIADDEQKMLHLLRDFLEREQYEVVTCHNGQVAYDLFIKHNDFDLVILDIMMPLMNGIETCEKIKQTSDVPIILLTAKTREIDELIGFHKGADEYIRKPFSPSVLVARVRALLKRKQINHPVFEQGYLYVDYDNHFVKVKDQPIKLSKIEIKLLHFFTDNINIVLSREQILNAVWGFDYEGTDRTVDTHINRLRIKLIDCGNYIQTVHGFGYRFEVLQ